jgi:predicted regulator of Ras-like GTPase activity (Roadblock/LC7/MglB family)
MMRDVLDSVTGQPGVRVAAIFSNDGLALCILEADAATGAWLDITSCAAPSDAAERDRVDATSIVAFAASWVDDLARTSGCVGWEFEKRFSMVASEGSLVIQLGPGANVLAVLEPEVDPGSVSLPMEVAVERLQRLLREMGRSDNVQPPAPFAGGQMESRGAANSAASESMSGAVPLHELMNDSVSEPGAASDVPAANAASDATNRSSGDH